MKTVDAAGWDRRYSESDRVWGSEPNIWVANELKGLAPGRALDLGAGEGRHAIWLAECGWQVQALDFSAKGLETGRRHAETAGVGNRIEWTVADACEIESPAESFDLVLVAYLQLPATQLEAAVTTAAAAIAPGGTFLLVNHDADNPEHGSGGPQDPNVLQKPDQVAQWLQEAGLEIQVANTRSRPVAGGLRPALDCVVLAKAQLSNVGER
ncbi:class I SAM-dependent methyltransferase [Micrococcaceae bacterium Sec5.8]